MAIRPTIKVGAQCGGCGNHNDYRVTARPSRIRHRDVRRHRCPSCGAEVLISAGQGKHVRPVPVAS